MIYVADLFAGAGGMSTGLMHACRALGVAVDLVAVNHWPTAVQTHTANHPAARHYCAPVESIDPRVVVPGGRLHLLMAAPECVHFSSARGGRPMLDQSRASAWHLLRWLELLRVDDVLIENVPEFLTWGPLGATGRPLKAQKGQTFRAFVAAVESLNYRVEWRILNAADYGEATTRRRLFIRARRGRKPIEWPEPTHGRKASASLLRHVRPWRAAREVIDWSIVGGSIFDRKRPLAPATMRRIIEGLKRFGGPELEPFILHLTHSGRSRSVDAPLPTITGANRGELGIAEPFLVPFRSERAGQRTRTHSLDEPLPTVTAGAIGFGIAEPFVISAGGANLRKARGTSEPLPTVMGSDRFALVQPFVVELSGTGDDNLPRSARSVDQPLGTIRASGTHHAVVEPFIFANRSNNAPKSIDDPVPPLCTGNHIALVEPFLLGQHGGATARPVSEPAPTVTTDGAISLVEPYLTQYYGSGSGLIARSVRVPLPPVTTKERFALVEPIVIDGKTLDIRFRMLKPHELSAAMGFPIEYEFTGTKTEHVKQIGNAVSVRTSRALCVSALQQYAVKGSAWEKEQIA